VTQRKIRTAGCRPIAAHEQSDAADELTGSNISAVGRGRGVDTSGRRRERPRGPARPAWCSSSCRTRRRHLRQRRPSSCPAKDLNGKPTTRVTAPSRVMPLNTDNGLARRLPTPDLPIAIDASHARHRASPPLTDGTSAGPNLQTRAVLGTNSARREDAHRHKQAPGLSLDRVPPQLHAKATRRESHDRCPRGRRPRSSRRLMRWRSHLQRSAASGDQQGSRA
jgi:hypothetical protein